MITCWCSVLSLKTLLGIVLLGVSCGYKTPSHKKEGQSTQTKRTVSDIGLAEPTEKEKSPKSNVKLSQVERYSLCSNRII